MNVSSRLRRALAGVAMLVLLTFSGCWKDGIFWSPDGSRAAIITEEGFYLTDSDGKLSPLLASGIYRVAWLGDSQRLVLARKREIGDYATLAKTLGPERTRALATEAEIVWQQLLATPQDNWDALNATNDDADAIRLYLREFHGEAVLKKYSEKGLEKRRASVSANWHSLVMARLVGDKLELGPTLHEGLAAIAEIRPAPDGSAVAFVAATELNAVFESGPCLFLAPSDGHAEAVVVASQTSAFPDWTPDGRALVYLKGVNDKNSRGEVQLGSIVEREVLDADGHIKLAEKNRELAGLIFQGGTRVRCLRDGRVMFAAADIHLPAAAGTNDDVHEQLFTVDRIHDKSPLVPLISAKQLKTMPNSLNYFDVSPDQTQVLCGIDNQKIFLLTLATGKVEQLSLPLTENASGVNPPYPAWRRAGEFVYLRKGATRADLVLRKGESETVLSGTWSDEMLKKLIE